MNAITELAGVRDEIVRLLVRVNHAIDTLARAPAVDHPAADPVAEPLRAPGPRARVPKAPPPTAEADDRVPEQLEPKRRRRVSDAGRMRMKAGALRRHENARAAKAAAVEKSEIEIPPVVEATTSTPETRPAPTVERPARKPSRLMTADEFAAELAARGVEPQAPKPKRVSRLNAEEQRLLADYHKREADLEAERGAAAAAPAEPPDPKRFEARSRFRRDGDDESAGPIQVCRPGIAVDNTPTLATAFEGKPERKTSRRQNKTGRRADVNAQTPWRGGGTAVIDVDDE